MPGPTPEMGWASLCQLLVILICRAENPGTSGQASVRLHREQHKLRGTMCSRTHH